VLSREQQDIAALNGHLDAAKARLLLRHMVPAETVDHVLVCGPPPMTRDLVGALPAPTACMWSGLRPVRAGVVPRCPIGKPGDGLR